MSYFEPLKPSDITASQLILSLLSATPEGYLSTAQLVSAGSLFEIDPTALRMAVSRLIRDERVMSVRRGVYAIGPTSKHLNDFVTSWRRVRTLKTNWTGEWLAVLTSHLGRSDRKRLRVREHALQLFGFAHDASGGWVRPANLDRTLSDIKNDLTSLGVEAEAIYLRIAESVKPDTVCWRTRWDVDALNRSYRDADQILHNSSKALANTPLEEAAQISFLHGQSVIALINRDPLLPFEILGSDAFDQMHSQMLAFDKTGREIWSNFFSKNQT
ncbi:MAG: hypothetical protein AAFV59_09350 [Pseudomonadota bacterium]